MGASDCRAARRAASATVAVAPSSSSAREVGGARKNSPAAARRSTSPGAAQNPCVVSRPSCFPTWSCGHLEQEEARVEAARLGLRRDPPGERHQRAERERHPARREPRREVAPVAERGAELVDLVGRHGRAAAERRQERRLLERLAARAHGERERPRRTPSRTPPRARAQATQRVAPTQRRRPSGRPCRRGTRARRRGSRSSDAAAPRTPRDRPRGLAAARRWPRRAARPSLGSSRNRARPAVCSRRRAPSKGCRFRPCFRRTLTDPGSVPNVLRLFDPAVRTTGSPRRGGQDPHHPEGRHVGAPSLAGESRTR